MPVTAADLEAFHQFAQAKLGNGGAETLHELVDRWESQKISFPAPQKPASQKNDAAQRAAIKDRNEDRNDEGAGRDARLISHELRPELEGDAETRQRLMGLIEEGFASGEVPEAEAHARMRATIEKHRGAAR